MTPTIYNTFVPLVINGNKDIWGIEYGEYLSDGGPIQCDKIALLGWTDIITKLKGCDTDTMEAKVYITKNIMMDSKENQWHTILPLQSQIHYCTLTIFF